MKYIIPLGCFASSHMCVQGCQSGHEHFPPPVLPAVQSQGDFFPSRESHAPHLGKYGCMWKFLSIVSHELLDMLTYRSVMSTPMIHSMFITYQDLWFHCLWQFLSYILWQRAYSWKSFLNLVSWLRQYQKTNEQEMMVFLLVHPSLLPLQPIRITHNNMNSFTRSLFNVTLITRIHYFECSINMFEQGDKNVKSYKLRQGEVIEHKLS